MGFGLSGFIPLAIYLVAIIVFFMMVAGNKHVGLYFIVGFIPLQVLKDRIVEFPLGKDIVDIFVLVLILIAMMSPSGSGEAERQEKLVNPTPIVLFYFCLTYAYLWWGSILHGEPLPISLNTRFVDWKNHIVAPLMFLVTLRLVENRKQLAWVCLIMAASLFLISFKFSKNYVRRTAYHEDERNSGVFSYLGPNDLGAFCAQYAVLVMGIALLARIKYLRLFLWGLFYLNVYCTIFTFSRGAYVALALGVIYIAAARRNWFLIILIIVLGTSWRALAPRSVIERMDMTKQGDTLETSAEGRLGRWRHGLELFARNPMGHGFNTVQLLGFRGHTGELSSRGDPHNRYVEYLVEMGIPGLLLFLYLFRLAFKSGRLLYLRSSDPTLKGLGLGFSGAVLACAAANFFGDRWTYEIVSTYFWVSWALVLKGLQFETERAASETESEVRDVVLEPA